jgi:hypothetical protein
MSDNALADPAVERSATSGRGDRAPRWIEDITTINALLSRAAEQRLILAVGGLGEARNSLLLEASPQERALWIDPPFPLLAEPPAVGVTLSLSTRIEGAALDFSSVYLGEVDLGTQPAYKLVWPQRVRHLQRRSDYRLGIPRELRVPPAMIRDHQKVFAATLVDLSRTGAGAMVPRSTRVQAGEIVACTIRIANLEFIAEAEVRSCIASIDRMRLGLLFGQIKATDALRLSTAVAQLERTLLRHQALRRERLRGL